MRLQLLCIILAARAQAESVESFRYCIIGAGPAGVQLGQHFLNADRDYITLEKAPKAASWFSKFPIHRQLNSINRRQTRSGHPEFNIRHDWNSLLDAPNSVPLFREWTKEYWPPADVMVNYINAYAAPQVSAGKLQFGQTVTRINKCSGERGGKPCNYLLSAISNTTTGTMERTISCTALVMANGMSKPRAVTDWFEGLEKVQTSYDDLAGVSIDNFENRSVLILGTGNAAAETADAVRNVARDIQVIGRYSDHKLMRDTHYVGDLRGRRTTHLDAFNLKSYEGAISISGHNLVMVPCGPDEDNKGFMGHPPVCTFELLENVDDEVKAEDSERYAVLAAVNDPDTELIDEAFRLFGDDLVQSGPTELQHREKVFAQKMNVSYIPALRDMLLLPLSVLTSDLSLEQRRLLIRLRLLSIELTKTGEEFQYPYDIVVAATGWQWDGGSIVDDIAMTGPPNRPADQTVYPKLNSQFESVSHSNLFVAGAAAHGPDRYRYKASGGFIHGFRFNVRSLWRMLEDRYEDPTQQAGELRERPGVTRFGWGVAERPKAAPGNFSSMNGLPEKLSPLHNKLFDRINNAAGPYEQVGGALADAIIFDGDGGNAWYIEDVPEDLIHERYAQYPRFTFSFHYGSWHGPLGPPAQSVCQLRTVSSGIFSNYVHPILQYFPPGVLPEGAHQKYMYLLEHGVRDGSMSPQEHPSSVFTTPLGVSRVHVKEAYIFLDWKDTTVVQLLEFFLGHTEYAANTVYMHNSNGFMNHTFDEHTDTRFYDQTFHDEYQRIYEESCNPSPNHQDNDSDEL